MPLSSGHVACDGEGLVTAERQFCSQHMAEMVVRGSGAALGHFAYGAPHDHVPLMACQEPDYT